MSMIYGGHFLREALQGVRSASRSSARMWVQVQSSFRLILSGALKCNLHPRVCFTLRCGSGKFPHISQSVSKRGGGLNYSGANFLRSMQLWALSTCIQYLGVPLKCRPVLLLISSTHYCLFLEQPLPLLIIFLDPVSNW